VPLLVVLSGLPGGGKTTLARGVARASGAVFLRIDTIEAALRRSVLRIHPAEDAGYVAAMGLAADNLALGRDVVADAVNPDEGSRRAWAELATGGAARLVNVEVLCSDTAEHRRRVEARRAAGGPDPALPDWAAVQARGFEPWQTPRLVIDTAGRDIAGIMRDLLRRLA